MNSSKQRIGLWIFILAYAFCVYWCFFHARPVFQARPVTITYAHWQLERGPPAGFAAVMRRYEELHPNVKVEQLIIPGLKVYPQWMRSNLAGDNGPDILEWGSWVEGGKDIPARYFEPLTAELAKPNPYDRGTSQEKLSWENTFHDQMIAPRRDSPDPGQIYGVSVSEVVLRLFCNIRLLREITGSDAPPQTYAELRRILEQTREFSQRTGRKVAGFAGSRDHADWIAEQVMCGPLLKVALDADDDGYLLLYTPESLSSYLEGKWSFTEPAVKAGLQLTRDVTQAMKPGFMQLLRDDALIEYFRGQAVFIYSGTWDATSLRQIAPFPVVPMMVPQVTSDDPEVGRYVIGPKDDGVGEGTEVMYLNKNSAHKAVALDFLRFLTSVEGQQIFTDNSGWLPTVNGVNLPAAIKEFRQYARGYAFAISTFDNIGSEENLVWRKNFYLLTGDQGSVDKFAAAMERDAPAAIRRDLEDTLRDTLLLVKPEDTAIVANAALASASPAGSALRIREEQFEMGQTISEGLAFKMAQQLEETKGRR